MPATRLFLPLGAAVLATMLALAPAQARSSGGSSHSSSSHSSGTTRSSHTGTRTTAKSKALPAGTHFVRKTCKTASCKAKHPGGSYMLPIKPKKTG